MISILTQEAIDRQLKIAEPDVRYRIERLAHEAAECLSVEAVRVAIKEHRKASPFMPKLCDLVQHSTDYRRDRQADNHRRAVVQEAAERRALPAPRRTPEEEAAYDMEVARLIREIEAAPGPETLYTGKKPPPAPPRDWLKPPEHSDLSPELKALAIEKGWARPAAAA